MRFNTDQALFETFPTAADHVKTKPTGSPPAAFLRGLLDSSSLDEAISFCAYLLPRREAVAWGCACVRQRLCQDGARDAASSSLLAAQAWADAPSDERRRAAYAGWERGNKSDPADWLALGAAWSGGSVVPGLDKAAPAAPHLTATMIRVALLLLLHSIPERLKAAAVREWIAAGVRLAESGL